MERKYYILFFVFFLLSACNDIEKKSVTLSGTVLDLSTGMAPTDAVISYQVGDFISGNVEITDGNYTITGLPGNSDVTLLIESTSDAFMPLETIKHTYETDYKVNYQTVSEIQVSPAVTFYFPILDLNTKEAITDLNFTTMNYNDSDYSFVTFTSSFDVETQLYSVTVPKFGFSFRLLALLDTNGDGLSDYRIHANGNQYCCSTTLVLENNYFSELTPMYLSKLTTLTEPQSLQVRMTVVDENLNNVVGAELFVLDALNDTASKYNSELAQYSLDLKVLNKVQITLPSFEYEDTLYHSNLVTLTLAEDETILVKNEMSSHYQFESNYTVEKTDQGVDIVVYTKTLEHNNDSNLTLVASSDTVNPEDYSYKMFFSVPVKLTEGKIELLHLNKLTVTKGNSSDVDLILPGYTSISFEDTPVELDIELSLNNTLLTISPKTKITAKNSYRLTIEEVLESSTDQVYKLNESKNFISEVKLSDSAMFDINSIVLDNNNFMNNDAYIVQRNTADIVYSGGVSNSHARLFFPKEIHLLKNFTMKKNVVTSNGVTSYSDTLMNIVKDGTVRVDSISALSLAKNEEIILDSYYSQLLYGTSLTDGQYWATNSIQYLSDNTDSVTNSISFEYSYETLSGEIHTGTIELPVQ